MKKLFKPNKKTISLIMAALMVVSVALPTFASTGALDGEDGSQEAVVEIQTTPEPTQEPTPEPTQEPIAEPTLEPTVEPTAEPTDETGAQASPEPTDASETQEPDTQVSPSPSKEPELDETGATETPTVSPSPTPSEEELSAATIDELEGEALVEISPSPTPTPTATPEPFQMKMFVHQSVVSADEVDSFIATFAGQANSESLYAPAYKVTLTKEVDGSILDDITPSAVTASFKAYYLESLNSTGEIKQLIDELVASDILPENIGEYNAMYSAYKNGNIPAEYTNTFTKLTKDLPDATPIVWYVMKDQSTGLHVDGMILDAYTVTYALNGGNWVVSGSKDYTRPNLHYSGQTINVTSTYPTKAGHIFTGWELSSNNTVYPNGSSFPMPSEPIVLSAQWMAIDDLVINEGVGTDLVNGAGLSREELEAIDGIETYSFELNPGKSDREGNKETIIQDLVDTLKTYGYTTTTSSWTWTVNSSVKPENGYAGGNEGPYYNNIPTRIIDENGGLKNSPWYGTVTIPLKVGTQNTSITIDWSFNLTAQKLTAKYYENQEAFNASQVSTTLVDANDYFYGETTTVIENQPTPAEGFEFTSWALTDRWAGTSSNEERMYNSGESLTLNSFFIELVAQYQLKEYNISANEMTAVYSKNEIEYDKSKLNLGELDANNATIIYKDSQGNTLESAPVDVGTYTVEVSLNHPGDETVKITTNTTLKITPKPVTVTAKDDTKIYGQEDELGYEGYEIDGILSGDEIGATFTVTRPSMSVSEDYPLGQKDNKGEYDLVPEILSGTINPNYTIETDGYINGTLEITARNITLKASDAGKIYGEVDPEFTIEIDSGVLANDDEIEDLFGEGMSPVVQRVELEDIDDENVGNYVNGLAIFTGRVKGFEESKLNENYEITYKQGDFEIVHRPVNIIAEDSSKFVNEDDPSPFEYTLRSANEDLYADKGYKMSGPVLVDDNDLGTILVGRPNANTQNDENHTYVDALVVSYNDSANYVVTTQKGDFTINPVTTSIIAPKEDLVIVAPTTPEIEPELPEVPEVQIERVEVSADTAPEISINEANVPLAGRDSSAWALVNLILTILTSLISFVLIIKIIARNNKDEEDEENTTSTRNNKTLMKLLSVIPAIATIVLFIYTQDITLPRAMIDEYTIPTAVITVIQLVIALLSKSKVEKETAEEKHT